MPDSHPTSGKEPYHQALKESDEQKLTELVQAAEHAIVFRLQELENSTDNQVERIQMKRAAADLLAIKTYKLRLAGPARLRGSAGAPLTKTPSRCGKTPTPTFPSLSLRSLTNGPFLYLVIELA